MSPYPFLFQPILKPRVWGGRLLESLGKTLPPNEKIGESWEVADLPEAIEGGRSVIANGELKGRSLHQAIVEYREAIMGEAALSPEGGFPLLIKFLDAQENLSVQVHPDANYAATHREAHLKSEAWVIINSVPGSVIYKGINPKVTAEEFRRHIQTGEVVDDLVAVQANIGDCHYLPSGVCHALGAGVMVAEIQTPSDTTFRVFDWGRQGRELHIEQAMQCIRFGDRSAKPSASSNATEAVEVQGLRTQTLCRTEFFTINRLDAIQAASFRIVTNNLPEVWMIIQGTGEIAVPDQAPTPLHPGTTTLIPAALDGAVVSLDRAAWLLRVQLPGPHTSKIA